MIGTDTNHIIFTSTNPAGNWNGVYLATNSGGKTGIDYAEFSKANTAISVECCWGVEEPAIITNSTFKDNYIGIGNYAG